VFHCVHYPRNTGPLHSPGILSSAINQCIFKPIKPAEKLIGVRGLGSFGLMPCTVNRFSLSYSSFYAESDSEITHTSGEFHKLKLFALQLIYNTQSVAYNREKKDTQDQELRCPDAICHNAFKQSTKENNNNQQSVIYIIDVTTFVPNPRSSLEKTSKCLGK